ncbi:hypothetical protein OV079_46035 [Nannocystis pusilla]|uniref:HTTM domain-containing protein n=1 Tax=Nannocystis pusilla TaxID=889268 RepID=A0A9X3J453_9BACT|nr:hypothetical protein [Nannocystis pusilla]MCY1012778.1 hypothetical protein [Nannocystis pusilla]
MNARLDAALRAIDRFFFAPARPAPLVALRIGLAAVLLAQALQIAPLFHALYHHGGLLRGPLMDAFGPRHLPPLGELLATPFESQALAALGLLYVASLVGMLLGWRTRLSTGAAWLLHFAFMRLAPHTTTAPTTSPTSSCSIRPSPPAARPCRSTAGPAGPRTWRPRARAWRSG